MILYHVTPQNNLPSITRYGLAAYRGIWFCTAHKLPWALHHISIHKGVSISYLAILKLRIKRSEVRKRRQGVYWSKQVPNYTKIR